MGKKFNIYLLDCTLRDGGLALADSAAKGIFQYEWNEGTREKIASILSASKIDIVELGSIEISESDKRKYAIYQSIEEISEMIPRNTDMSRTQYAALYRGPDTPIDAIPNWNPSLCRLIRVIIRYSEMQKSMDFCTALAEKGYLVSVQPMLTARYTEKELQYIAEQTNKMKAFAVYFVDSYGYLQEQDILYFFSLFDTLLSPTIKIGFHAHNNMNLAFSNVKTFLTLPSSRDRIVDSCVMGLGQGAGNAQTELVVNFLCKECKKDYHFTSILKVAEILDANFIPNICGYSITYLLPALYGTAYKYAIDLRYKHRFSYTQIEAVLKMMKDEKRHRYTPEDLNDILIQYQKTQHQ